MPKELFIASSFFLNLTEKNAKKQLFLWTFEVALGTDDNTYLN
jgi:hypothetical protein